MNINGIIRLGLKNGISEKALLRRAKHLSQNPDAWNFSSIERVKNSFPHQVGIELEYLSPINSDHQQIIRELKNKFHWKRHTDYSVEPLSYSQENRYNGCNELVSPPLKNATSVKKVCNALKKAGCIVNKTCGTHVHHDLSYVPRKYVKMVLTNALFLYSIYHRKFSRIAKRSPNDFCMKITKTVLNEISNNPRAIDRHYAVNPDAYWKHSTIEFRQHKGTLNADEITSWINITYALVNRAVSLAKKKIDLSAQNYEYSSFKKELINN